MDDSTLHGVAERSSGALARNASRAFIALLLLACIAGGIGLLGGHTATTVNQRHDYRMALSYPGTTRPGLDVFWELRVTHPDGFRRPIRLAVTGSYFDLFETQGFYPTPSVTTRDAKYVYFTFTPPKEGDTFVVMYDAYVQPYVAPTHYLANDASVSLIDNGQRVNTIHFTTWMLP